MSATPIRDWVQLLRQIPQDQPANPLEELSCLALKENVEEKSSSVEENTVTETDQDQLEDIDFSQNIEVEDTQRLSQRQFDHPASAGFRCRTNSGQQFRFGEHHGPYTKRGHRKIGFK